MLYYFFSAQPVAQYGGNDPNPRMNGGYYGNMQYPPNNWPPRQGPPGGLGKQIEDHKVQ